MLRQIIFRGSGLFIRLYHFLVTFHLVSVSIPLRKEVMI